MCYVGLGWSILGWFVGFCVRLGWLVMLMLVEMCYVGLGWVGTYCIALD